MGDVSLKGIDVSKHNGTIDWSVAKHSIDFAMLRAGWSWYQGGMNIDTKFMENVSGCTVNSIPFGVYLYAYDLTEEAAVASANKLADVLKQNVGTFDFPVVYDFEDNQYLKKGVSKNTLICDAFLRTIKSRGFYPMLYTYTNFAIGYLDMDYLKDYSFWVADYRSELGYKNKWDMWQYSSTETVPGVSTKVDMNTCHVDFPAIIQSYNLNGYKPAPTPENKDIGSLIRELEELIGRYK